MQKRLFLSIYLCTTAFCLLAQKKTAIDTLLDTSFKDSIFLLTSSVHTAKTMHQVLPLFRSNDQTSLAGQLNQLPGVQMQIGALNTNRIVMRGIGSRTPFGTSKIRVYLDDIPLTNGAGETSVEDIDLSFFEKIQIRKGPSSSLFGVGLGGMIQLNTPTFTTNKSALSSTIGSFGLFRQTLALTRGNAAKNRSIALKYSYLSKDGYRDNSAYRRHGFQVNGQFGALSYLLNVTDLRSEIPSALNATDYELNPTAAAANWAAVKGYEDYQKVQAGLAHCLVFGEKSNWSMRSAIFAAFRPAYESRPFNILEENSLYGGLRSRILHEKRLSSSNTVEFSTGLELFQEKYDWTTFQTNGGVQGATLSDNAEIRRYGNVFVESRFSSNRHSFILGLNANRTQYKANNLTDKVDSEHDFGTIVSPLFQYEFEASPNTSLFLWTGHGFSPPATEETQGTDGRFNTSIRPEQGWNIETGLRLGQSAEAFQVRASVFTIFVKDLLVSRRNAIDQWEGINAGKTQHTGAEIWLRWPFLQKTTRATLQTAYTYAHYRFTEFTDRDKDYGGNPLTGVPAHQTSVLLDFVFPKQIAANVEFLAVGKMPLRDDNTLNSDSYQLVNLQFSKAFSLKKGQINADFGIKNIFNAHYTSMLSINASAFGGALPRYYYPGDARSFYARGTYLF